MVQGEQWECHPGGGDPHGGHVKAIHPSVHAGQPLGGTGESVHTLTCSASLVYSGYAITFECRSGWIEGWWLSYLSVLSKLDLIYFSF